MLTAQDIEVFVLTHKRPLLLKETIEGYLHQSVQGFRLAIFSNGHSPQTKQVVQAYAGQGVELFYVDEELAFNLSRALQAASRQIVVIAHDDDFIHPQYIETLLVLFNKYPKLGVIVSGQTDDPHAWDKKPQNTAYHFNNEHEFAAYIYNGGGFTYSSACYKTQAAKHTDPRNFVQYGKVSDVPFMTAICTGAEAAVTVFPFIKTRIHDQQDTFAYETGPTAQQWFALSLFYKKLLDIPQFPRLRWLFRLQNYRHIRLGWRDWCKCEYANMNFYQFCRQALSQGALKLSSIGLGLVLRGKLSHYLQTKLAQFEMIRF